MKTTKQTARGKMKNRAIAMVVVAISMAAMVVQGATDLPYGEGFESKSFGSWSGDSAISFTVLNGIVTNLPSPTDGSQKLLYSPDELDIDLITTDAANGFNTNVTWSAYAQIRTAEADADDPVIGTDAAAFFIDAGGNLKAYSNDQWVVVQTGVPTNGWTRFSVHLDFNAKQYNIYRSANTFEHGDALIRVNVNGPLAFNTAYASQSDTADTDELAQVKISGETSIDDISMARSSSALDTTTGANTIQTFSSPSEIARVNTTMTAPNIQFFAETNYLDGPFGDILHTMFENGDQLSVYVDGDWQTFEWNGTVWSPVGGAVIADTPITATTAMRFIFQNPELERYVSGVASGSGTHPASVDVEPGWNGFSLPFSVNNSRTLGSLGISPENGDRIILNDESSDFKSATFYNGSWYPSAYRNMTIPVGASFYYYRAGTSTTWSID